jgi:pyruvate dehydrogenase E2 component (dihydrolipoamide acetyltransferase)
LPLAIVASIVPTLRRVKPASQLERTAMATEFLMPKLGLTMEEGTIIEWLVADGDAVEVGAAILRIETDKTETEVEATSAGRLHVVGRPGDTFGCGERIGWLLAPGEESPVAVASAATVALVSPSGTTGVAQAPSPSHVGSASAPAAGGRIMASPLAKRRAAERNIDLRAVRGTGPDGRIVAADVDEVVVAPPAAPAPQAPPSSSSGGMWPATAAARMLADLLGIDVAHVPLDPVDGYVTRESVARYVRGVLAAAAGPAPATPSTVPVMPSASAGLASATQAPSSTIRLSGMRGTIAKRMRDSLTQMAQLTLHMDADFEAVVADRARRSAQGRPPSYTDYVIAAAARALVQHPIANSQITDDGVALLPAVHVGMAVALDAGLIVPVISDTASRDLSSLSIESSRLAAAARDGALKLAELEGGTFSVSTLGMFGVDGFTPVINPPNTCILGVGRLRSDLVLGPDGTVDTRQRVTLSLTWDHRAFDGAPAAAFCASIVELLNDPDALDAPTT